MSEENTELKPWGYFTVLADEADHKVKRIVVHPGHRLSLQRHMRRSEHWHALSGQAVVTREKEEIAFSAGQSMDIPQGAWHRVQNEEDSPFVFIEVQPEPTSAKTTSNDAKMITEESDEASFG